MGNDNVGPGIAAIAIAILYPLYWLLEITVGTIDLSMDRYMEELGWNYLDWMFLALGCLIIYLAFSLRRILLERHNFDGIDIPIFIIIAASIMFYFGLALTEIVLIFFGDELSFDLQEILATIGVLTFFAYGILAGVAEVLMGALLMRRSDELPEILRTFGLVTLILGICDLTIILGFATLVLYPLSLFILAVYFLQKPRELELV